nr:immunoglobulin light chain junction region [Macaca mulatta]
CQQHKSHPLTL